MTVEQLMEHLKTLPPKSTVYFVDFEGCHECNPECMPHYHEVGGVGVEARGEYPWNELVNVVKMTG